MSRSHERSWHVGVPQIDDALPEGGLSQYGVHEISAASHADTSAALGYLLALTKRLQTESISISAGSSRARKLVLFCQTFKAQREFGPLYAQGLHAFGFSSDDFMFVNANKNNDVLWALEEGARSGCLTAIIGEIDALSFTQTRRLSLAAALTGTPVLLLRSHHDLAASAAVSRWRVRALSSGCDPLTPAAPHHMRWQLEICRCRGGRPGIWHVEWNHEAHRFSLAQKLRTGSTEMANQTDGAKSLRCASV